MDVSGSEAEVWNTVVFTPNQIDWARDKVRRLDRSGELTLQERERLKKECPAFNLLPSQGHFLPFTEARVIARSLITKSGIAYRAIGSEKLYSLGLPVNADGVYRNQGWQGWNDYLGSNMRMFTFDHTRRGFETARKIARRGHYGSVDHYKRDVFQKPHMHLPSTPHKIWRDFWRGWPDFLGTDRRKTRVQERLTAKIELAWSLANKNGGFIPSYTDMNKQGQSLSTFIRLHPKDFSHIPRAIKGTSTKGLVGFRGGTAAQRRALEKKHGLPPGCSEKLNKQKV